MLDKQLAYTKENTGPRSTRNIFGMVAGLLLIVVVLFFVWMGLSLRAPGTTDETVSVSIPLSASLSESADILERASAIKNATAFQLYAIATGSRADIKAGTYSFTANESARDVLGQLTTGKRADEVTITLIEGWKMTQVEEYLPTKKVDITTTELSDAFTKIIQADAAAEKKYAVLTEGLDLSAQTVSVEGYMYPDTYKVFANVTAEELVSKTLANFAAKLTADDKAKIAASNYSFHQILTLASIVEKEVANDADRAVVAGIFLNRLSQKYPLQSDATVNYFTDKKDVTPSGADLAQQSAYNTYQRPGLPPGPISNPSMSSIRAVLNPTPSDYLFFLTTVDKKTIFSKTYDEHLQNKAKYITGIQ